MTQNGSPEPVVAIMVAAGSGVRLGGEVPKALRELAGRALVRWSLEALAAGGVTHAVVVVAEGLQGKFTDALADAPIPFSVVVGGATRQESVARGIAALPDGDVVLVHDAARPLVPAQVVRDVVAAVRAGASAAIPVVPVSDTIRQVTGARSVIVDRRGLRAVQTPQGFAREALVTAHAAAAGAEYTDDAAVCEALGYEVVLVPGSREALKITEPHDLAVAEAIVRARG
ncbi:MAG TPA: 2-C-methyl-D-erythritol 4-phosphate cytidylyltransferase [Propionibacteriaceae bacterium]|nr:2-C-methyl-D-erythritol 4-phosphate cytidylyltransferase [Propionibacteriaceae bacterium]